MVPDAIWVEKIPWARNWYIARPQTHAIIQLKQVVLNDISLKSIGPGNAFSKHFPKDLRVKYKEAVSLSEEDAKEIDQQLKQREAYDYDEECEEFGSDDDIEHHSDVDDEETLESSDELNETDEEE